MAPKKTYPAFSQPFSNSIDDLVSAPTPFLTPSSSSKRPVFSPRPSWIGPAPSKPTTPGISTMKQSTTIHYSSPGLQPPVYIITSLSDPQWDTLEMEHTKNGEGEHEFTKTFSAEPGEYQYKFRLGPGDWWVFDEHKPTVDDGFGNKNNLLVLEPQLPVPSTQLADHERLTPGIPGQRVAMDSAGTPAATTPAPLMGHESYFPHPRPAEATIPAPAPLMAHEALLPQTSQPTQEITDSHHDTEASTHPLLPHEAVSPDSTEQHHSPLFSHESNGLHNRHDEPTSPTTQPHSREVNSTRSPSQVQAEATRADHATLDKFPTDEAGIMATLRRASVQHDSTAEAEEGVKTPESRAVSDSSGALQSVQEAAEEAPLDAKTADPRPKQPDTPPLTPSVEDKGAAAGEKEVAPEEEESEATRREEREQEEMDAEKVAKGDEVLARKEEARGPKQLMLWLLQAFWQWMMLFVRGKKPLPLVAAISGLAVGVAMKGNGKQ